LQSCQAKNVRLMVSQEESLFLGLRAGFASGDDCRDRIRTRVVMEAYGDVGSLSYDLLVSEDGHEETVVGVWIQVITKTRQQMLESLSHFYEAAYSSLAVNSLAQGKQIAMEF